MEDELYIIWQIAIDDIKYSKNKQSATNSLCFVNMVYCSLCGKII